MSIDRYLQQWAAGNVDRASIAQTLLCIADASRKIAHSVSRGPLAEDRRGDALQIALEQRAHQIVLAALRGSPVAVLGSNQCDEAIPLNANAPLAAAIAPLAGSTNLDTNLSLGTTFALFPRLDDTASLADSLLQQGDQQLAAGFVIYGPQTVLVLTVRAGTHSFILDRDSDEYLRIHTDIKIPERGREFAINASNSRFWDAPVRAFFDDCLAGAEGPHGEDFNMRWVGSVVAETYRVLIRGGVFLYPDDSRSNFMDGRMTLVSKAFPIALLVEQADGAATDGEQRILDILPTGLKQCVPLVYGSRETVNWVVQCHEDPTAGSTRFPLFGKRQLFR